MSRLYKIGPNTGQGFIRFSNPAAALSPTSFLSHSILGGTGGPLGPEESESPTGARPRFIWTPHIQWVMEQKRLTNHWTWQKLSGYAISNPYGTHGQHKALVYQTTGDSSWAAGAFTEMINAVNVAMSGNNTRAFIKQMLVADILMPYIISDSTRLTTWQEQFFRRMDYILNVRGARINDSDEANSFYWILAWAHFWPFPGNIYYGNTLNQTLIPSPPLPAGGLDATAPDQATLRNCIDYYVTAALGGEWIESSNYNEGTLDDLFMGFAGLQTVAPGHFPLVQQLINDNSQRRDYQFTPTKLEQLNWGDVDAGQHGILPDRYFNSFCWQHYLTTDVTAKRRVQKTINEFLAVHQASMDTHLTSRTYYIWDPNEAQEAGNWEWQSSRSSVYFSGMNILKFKGSDYAGSIRGFMQPKGLDHSVTSITDHVLIVNDKWVWDRPQGYSGTGTTGTVGGYYHNTILLAGMDRMYFRGPNLTFKGSDWDGMIITTSGARYTPEGDRIYDNIYYNPPPKFVYKCVRSYCQIKIGNIHYLVIRDDTDAVNPQTLSLFSRYRASDQAFVNTFMAETPNSVARAHFHTHLDPTLDPDVSYWRDPSGTYDVGVKHLAPATFGRIVKLATSGPVGIKFAANEQIDSKRFLGFYNTVASQTNIFLNVQYAKPLADSLHTITMLDTEHVQIGTKVITITDTSISVSP